MDVNRLNLLPDAGAGSDTQPGDAGFKLTGLTRKEPLRRVRLWVRRRRGQQRRSWYRNLEPAAESTAWEVVAHEEKSTGAMTLVDFDDDLLKRLLKDYRFTSDQDRYQALESLDHEDPLFARVKVWALKALAQGNK